MLGNAHSKVVLLSKYQKAGGGIGIKTKLSPKKLISPYKQGRSKTAMQMGMGVSLDNPKGAGHSYEEGASGGIMNIRIGSASQSSDATSEQSNPPLYYNMNTLQAKNSSVNNTTTLKLNRGETPEAFVLFQHQQ